MPSGVYTRTTPRSLEVRKRISQTLKGRPSPMKGRKHSAEAKQRISAFNKGRPPYKMTDEIKQKISDTKKGRPMSVENRAKIAASSKRGALHHNWKGGVSSSDYKERRRFQRFYQMLVFQRDNFTCQVCQKEGSSLQVDHIKSWSEHPELRFELDNCRTLCMGCHYFVTFKRKLPQGVIWGHNLSRRIEKSQL